MNRLRTLWLCLCPALLLLGGLGRAQTLIWSDNFETNATSHWTASVNNVWRIGAPTTGPAVNAAGFRTFSGANCAFTQGYRANTDARLIGNHSLVVPPSDQFPRLRFWHWFNCVNALGFVEISTNSGSTWNQISPTYENINSGGVWSRPYVDLSAYAGQRVQFAFRFYGASGGNGLGWYVDDVEVDTGTPSLNLPESFEFDPKTSDWSEDFGTWEIGHPTSGPKAAHTGTNCAATVLAGNYPANANTRLVSPQFLVPALTNVTLRYWQWYSFNNALGFVEINNGGITTTAVTNTVITTNTTATLNTNVYQLFGGTNPNYFTPLNWNPVMGGWTNETSAMGNVFDPSFGQVFESGNTPLTFVGNGNVDYRLNAVPPIPQTADATNFLDWQGQTWNSQTDPTDNPIGFFGTNSSSTFTTNTTVTVSQTSWNQVSPTFQGGNSGNAWIQESLDLSAYAGQLVQVAFHFGSASGTTAAGWYVDDLSLTAPPVLLAPTNQIIYAGQMLMVTNSATNSLLPNAQYTFKLLSSPANVVITNGVVTWQTTPGQPSSTNTITVVATDNSLPPLRATNSFTVTVVNPAVLTVPPTQMIYAGQTLMVTCSATNDIAPDDTFTFALVSPVWDNLDVSDLPVDGVINWPTALTQTAGTYTNIIVATDNPPYYSVTNSFLIVVSPTPPPVLMVPPNQTILAGQTLTVTNQATSAAFPGGPFTFALLSDPTGMDESDLPVDGVLVWNSYPTNKTSTKTITIAVTDDNSGLSATNSFKVTVSLTPATTLMLPGTQTNYAGMTLTVTNQATNTALSAAVFSFRLPSPSTNVFLTTNGVLTWTNTGVKNGILIWTNNSIAPGTQVITVAVDTLLSGYVSKPVTNHFNMVFLPPHPPSIIIPAGLAVNVGQTLTVTNVATNNYVLLANVVYTFKLVSTNALTTTNGVMTWTNTVARPAIYPLPVKVTDNSVPPLSATNNSTVTVLPLASQLALTNEAVLAHGNRAFTFNISTPWTNTPWRIVATTNLNLAATNWLPIYTNPTGLGGSLLFTDRLATNFLDRYYRAVFP